MEKIKKLILIVGLFMLGLFACIYGLENGFLFAIISFAIIMLFVYKVNIKRFSIFLVLFSLIIKVAAVLILNIPILADYEVMHNASLSALNGDFSFGNELYFTRWGYQLGHVLYQTLALRIVNNIVFLKILNCVYSTIIAWLIYKILKNITGEKSARIISLVYSISLYPIYLNCILGNQQLSLMLFLIGIYLLLTKKSTIKNLIIIGALFALGNIERPEGIIYISTLIIYNIITLKNIKSIIKNTGIILITYLIITQIASFALVKTGVSPVGFKNTNPEWKFVLGFNPEYAGKNNLEDYKYIDDRNLEREIIKERITNFKSLPGLFYNKTKILWLYDDLDNTFNATNTTQFSQKIVKIVVNYIKAMNVCVIILAVIGLIKNKKINQANYFFIVNLLIYFATYLTIEVSARYYYNPQVSMIILSAIGLEEVIKLIENKKQKV